MGWLGISLLMMVLFGCLFGLNMDIDYLLLVIYLMFGFVVVYLLMVDW